MAKNIPSVREIFSGRGFPFLIVGCSLSVLCVSAFIGVMRFSEKARTEQVLSKQLSDTTFLLSRERRNVAYEKERREEAERSQKEEEERNQRYFAEVPLVVSTPDGKGRLVGFSRLREPNGTAQYSFLVKNGDSEVAVSGSIVNQSGKLAYSDDYSTPSDVRTSGEVLHSKPAPARLRIEFVVTSASSDKNRVGDTFYAAFVLPGSIGGSL